ncbi:hypothetical protein HID58_042402 [Brassica napus]|uniref:Transposase-associated domain-containing protein n=1 Tax=Brassica napus TaxID=3708 RepID=A0ABQ8BDK0_BRANA|nr:hypothetical protein HID58_042402 [Brassica napus]
MANKMSFYFQSREWMDQRIDPESNQVSEIFLGGVDAFIQFACNQEDYKERETLLCPCARCKNVKQCEARVVARHLFLYEKFNDVGESSGANHSTGEEEMLETPIWNAYEDHQQNIPEGESVVNAQPVDNTVLQTFMMLNCETFAPYERMFEEYMTRSIPDITPVAMQKAKDTNFAEWCKDYDDRRDQVAESSLLRVETHVVDDVSDYDLAPVNPPNDEYVSDVEMNSTRAPGTQAASPPMPPGATGPAVYHAGSPPMPPGATGAAPNHAASSSRSNSYPQMTLNAMLNSPARLSQPHLHPDKSNGALWFGIDPCIHAFIRATWQGYYMGPWKSWNKVPEERKDSWWQTFVNAKSKRGYVYGLGSEQFREHAPSSRVPNGIARNLDLEMRVGGLETTLQSVTSVVAGVKQDVSDMRQDFAATREAINQLLQTLRPPQAPTGQTSDHQAQAPTGQPNPPNGI